MKEPRIIVASESGIAIREVTDISDALSNVFGASGLILTERDLGPDFFDLRTRLAGELFQKFVNYQVRLAIVIADPTAYGQRFRELANEHKSHNIIRFVSSYEEARAWLES